MNNVYYEDGFGYHANKAVRRRENRLALQLSNRANKTRQNESKATKNQSRKYGNHRNINYKFKKA